MGVLDSVFGGRKGVVAMLLQTLGGEAVAKIAVGKTTDERTGEIRTTFAEKRVPFVPENATQNEAASAVPEGAANGLRRVATEIVGTVPAAFFDAAPRVGRDFLNVGGIDYRLERVETVRVGNEVVQFRLVGKRL